MAEPSIGEAIGLQGKTNVGNQLGDVALRMSEADKTRKLKRGIAEKAQEAKDQEKLYNLFRQKANLNRLVLPEAHKLLENTISEMERIKSSDTPHSSNEFSKLMLNIDNRMDELVTYSKHLDNFEQQSKYLNDKTKFYGGKLDAFMPVYKNANSLEDLQKYAEQNPNAFDNYFQLTPEGIPMTTAVSAIPYQKELAARVKAMNETILGQDVVSIPDAYGAKELRTMYVKPLYRVDAQNAYNNNKAAYASLGRPPRSIEEEVEDYMTLNPDVIEQVASKNNLDIKVDEDGQYNEDDLKKVKDILILSASQYSNPELKGKIIQEKKGNNITISTGNLSDPLAPTEEPEIVDLGATEMRDNKKLAKAVNLKATSLQKEDIQVDGVEINPSNKFFDSAGNSLSGRRKVTISTVRTYPYKLVNGVKVIAHDDELNQIKGVAPFVEFSESGKIYYTDLENYSYVNIAGSKYDVARLGVYLNNMKQSATNATKAMAGRTFKNSEELTTFTKPYLKKK